MRKVTLLFMAFITLIACESDKKQTEATKKKPAEQEEIDAYEKEQLVDYYGEYSGELPCDDCEMIYFKIALDKKQYYLKYAKSSSSGDTYFEEGNYALKENVLIFYSEKNNWRFKLKEQGLLMLNFEGRELREGEMNQYYLNRIN